MIKAEYHFPQGFLWGAATASHQVEGGITTNDWSRWELESGRIAGGERAGLACDWWGGRWKDDFALAAADGHNAHRLSIEWSRVEPEPGDFDEDALEAYREIIAGVLAQGLKPMVTLHHFTNPIWVMEQGGWHNPAVVDAFAAYTDKVMITLGDLVSHWVTINEPNVLLFAGYVDGSFPPGEQNLRAVPALAVNLLRAHATAYHIIHERFPTAQVGLAHHYRSISPARDGSFLDRKLAALRSHLFNDLFPVGAAEGKLHLIHRIRVPEAAGTQDFIGLNYYTREFVRCSLTQLHRMLSAGTFAEDAILSPTGFIAHQPAGLWEALVWARTYRLPIYITENGIEDANDDIRPMYLAEHLHQVWRAANFNWQLRGYFYWTLVDSFEWERGWTQPFGLYALDRETQGRTARQSARFFSEICHANGLSSDMIRRYAPQALDRIFPPRGSDELME